MDQVGWADGRLAAYRSALTTGEPPVVVFLHGALRRAEALEDWAWRLAGAAETVLLDLPGHGASAPSASASVAAMAEIVGRAIDRELAGRRVLLVGESLGGIVALAVAGRAGESPVRAVLAADPAMSTAKLWNVIEVFWQVLDGAPADSFPHRLAFEAFGIAPDRLEERIYYPLVGALRVPAIILTGDLPLLPPRATPGVACVFDAVDAFVLAALYPGKADVRQIANCGHVMLTEAPEACRAVIVEMLAAMGD